MTIAAGFRCYDGVVLCADTQMSVGYSKFPQSKLCVINEPPVYPGFVYAGDRDFSLMAIDQIAKSISLAKTEKSVPVVIRDEAIKIYSSYHSLSTSERILELQTLITIKHSKKRKLYLINGPTVSAVAGAECIGAGSYLGNYVTSTMFHKHVGCWQCAHMAAYLLFLAKQYVAFCGNDSDIRIFWDDQKGSTRFASDPLETISIPEMEEDFAEFQTKLSRVLLGLVDFKEPRQKYASVLREFTKVAAEIKAKRARQIEKFIKEFWRSMEEYEREHGSQSDDANDRRADS